MTIREVSIEPDGSIAVRTFSILAQDFPCASAVWQDGRIIGYKAWSRTQYVGDYDDWQVRELVEDWAAKNGIDSSTLDWYEEAANA